MTEDEIFQELKLLVVEVTGSRPEDVRPESVLVEDLGAESIDLVDLSFLIEEKFAITIEANEFEKNAKARIPDGVYEKDGRLTDAAIGELRKALPEVSEAKLTPGLRKAELPGLLTVSVFARLIREKLEEAPRLAPESGARAQG
jgi:acyl carrier protein